MKNIFLLGATGETGTEILKQLIREGHQMKILVRNPSRIAPDSLGAAAGQVQIIQGEVLEKEKLIQGFKGCDLIISALGTGLHNQYTEIYSQGGRNILHAMRENSISKLITITSGAIDMSDPGTDTFYMNRVIRPNYNKVYYDMTRWETILDDTKDIHWICVRPTYLTNKPLTGRYRVGLNHCPKKGWKICRADLADFIVKQVSSDEYVHQKPVLAY
jgi:putative NADH-flavin reductase